MTTKRGDTSLALKAGMWYVIGNVLLRGLAFLTIPIFSRLMSRADFGEFSNYINWQATLVIITGAELYNTLNRAYYDYQKNYDQYISSVTIASIGLTSIFYLIFLAASEWIFKIVSIPAEFIHILFITLMFQSCKAIYLARERTLYRYKSVMVISAISFLIPTLVSVLLVILLDDSLKLAARIYGFFVPLSLVGFFCALVMINRGTVFRLEHCKYSFKLAIPLLFHNLSAYLLISTNVTITKSIVGADHTSVISIAMSTVQILTILFQTLTNALITWLMDNLEQKNYDKIRKNTLVFIMVLFLISLAVIILAPEIVWILGGAKYNDAVNLVPGFVVAVFLQTLVSLFTIVLTYDKNVVLTAIATCAVTVGNIFAKVFLLRSYGVKILIYINIVSYMVLFILNYIFVRKAGYKCIVNINMIILVSLSLLVASILILYFYKHSVVRYLMTIVALCVLSYFVWKKRKKIIILFKSVKNA